MRDDEDDIERRATPIAGRASTHADEQRGGGEIESRILRVWEAVDEIHRDQKATLRKLGELTTAIEKDQKERRSLEWLKRPVWTATVAWVVIACAIVWAAWKSGVVG